MKPDFPCYMLAYLTLILISPSYALGQKLNQYEYDGYGYLGTEFQQENLVYEETNENLKQTKLILKGLTQFRLYNPPFGKQWIGQVIFQKTPTSIYSDENDSQLTPDKQVIWVKRLYSRFNLDSKQLRLGRFPIHAIAHSIDGLSIKQRRANIDWTLWTGKQQVSPFTSWKSEHAAQVMGLSLGWHSAFNRVIYTPQNQISVDPLKVKSNLSPYIAPYQTWQIDLYYKHAQIIAPEIFLQGLYQWQQANRTSNIFLQLQQNDQGKSHHNGWIYGHYHWGKAGKPSSLINQHRIYSSNHKSPQKIGNNEAESSIQVKGLWHRWGFQLKETTLWGYQNILSSTDISQIETGIGVEKEWQSWLWYPYTGFSIGNLPGGWLVSDLSSSQNDESIEQTQEYWLGTEASLIRKGSWSWFTRYQISKESDQNQHSTSNELSITAQYCQPKEDHCFYLGSFWTDQAKLKTSALLIQWTWGISSRTNHLKIMDGKSIKIDRSGQKPPQIEINR